MSCVDVHLIFYLYLSKEATVCPKRSLKGSLIPVDTFYNTCCCFISGNCDGILWKDNFESLYTEVMELGRYISVHVYNIVYSHILIQIN